MKRRFPTVFYNVTTLTGVTVALISFGLIVFLTVLDLLAGEQKPYMGILTFIILPAIMLAGIALVFIGAWRTHRLEKAGTPHEMHLPTIDLNDSRQRRAFVFIAVSGFLFLVFTAFGSYKAYEYTDSDQFCGERCHSVMHPEYTAYQNSPHARVGCVKCHIGSGAGPFVQSKLSGAYQVYSVLFDKYARPIATPIENLRPAQQTCEQCHWPRNFFSEKREAHVYYLSDEQNTPWHLDMLIRVGGGNDETRETDGIHWHMNIANEITYVAIDRQRQSIPWVHMKSRDGKVERTYRTTDSTVTDEQLAHHEKRAMDCIDCHNRPSHNYHPPRPMVDNAMAVGLIDPSLPFAKSVAMEAIDRMYSSLPIARDSIRTLVESYYGDHYPALAASRTAVIDQMVAELQRIYARNYFPEMGANWKRYPDNIGHMYYPGCFRCHDGKHVSDDGKVISKDCNVCHTIVAQQYEGKVRRVSLDGLPYQHPVDIGDAWQTMNCYDCHTAE